MHHTMLEGPLNCLSVNKDCSQVVVAGRNVFKIFSLEDEGFQERINLRVGRNLNLNYSAADVVWNPQDDHILASAATNGAVVTWNLNKSSRSKQELVFNEHKRSVNRVIFHSNEHQWLMSGSQDGFMKLFDLRKQGVTSTFSGKPECVRDIQFDPHHYFMFAAAYENGNVQIWDLRNPSRWERQFTAHGGPVFSIDWHPEEKNWIATAGRDKLVKVWDVITNRNTHTVQTIASVARIKWRPKRRFHITSCSLLVDCSINVWDIRRPYIPFAAFNEHKDSVTGIVWKPDDPHIFFSSSKDCKVYQHVFRDATRPADSANPVGIGISITGDVAHASSDKINNLTEGGGSQTKLPAFFRKNVPDRSEQFTMVTSLLWEFPESNEHLSMDWFVKSACRYVLVGRPLVDICEHNATVAMELERYQVAQTWQVLKLLFGTTAVSPSVSSKTMPSLAVKADAHKDMESDKSKVSSKPDKTSSQKDDKVKTIKTVEKAKKKKTETSGLSEDESGGEEEAESSRGGTSMLTSNLSSAINHNSSQGDFFFGEGNEETGGYGDDGLGGLQNGQDWNLQNEAFQLRTDIEEDQRPTSPDQLTSSHAQGDSPSSTNDSETGTSTHHHQVAVHTGVKQEILMTPPYVQQLGSWNATSLICDMLQHYANQGDVQMAACVMIVLGDKIKVHIDDTLQEQWFMSYIDLLSGFKLWSIATEVIKLSAVPAVSLLNQRSTTLHTACIRCGKILQRSGWLCDRCKGLIHTCSICHLPVKGLYVWCQGCTHGGHLDHLRDWFSKYKHCPTGCGHTCEYT